MPDQVDLTKRPDTTGPRTGNQSGQRDVASMLSRLPSFGAAPPGTPQLYNQMRSNPTIAIGRMVIHAPIKGANWTVIAKDNAPAGADDLVERHVNAHRQALMRDVLRVLDYGHQPYEIVWQEASGALVPRKFKALHASMTEIRVDRETGAYRGLKNGGAELPPEHTLLFTHDGEAGDMRGRPLLENIRANAWWPWMQLLKREGQLTTKIAGVMALIGYVPGEARDEFGAKTDNFDLAKKLGSSLGEGNVAAWPKVLAPWAQDMLNRNPSIDPDKLMAWTIQFIEPGRGHHGELIEAMRHYERLMLRGLLVPERSVTEGEHGTKAESASQASLAMHFAAEVQGEIIRAINRYIVDRVMALNYGPSAVGTVYLEAEQLVDEKAALMRDVVKAALSAPANVDLLQTITDLTGMVEMVGLPVNDVEPQADDGEDPDADLAEMWRAVPGMVMADTYELPQGAIDNAKKVLRWREEHGDDVRGMTDVGWGRARQIAKGGRVSRETVGKIASFARHRKNSELDDEFRNTPWRDAGYVAWLGWGGDAGIDWAQRIVAREDNNA